MLVTSSMKRSTTFKWGMGYKNQNPMSDDRPCVVACYRQNNHRNDAYALSSTFANLHTRLSNIQITMVDCHAVYGSTPPEGSA